MTVAVVVARRARRSAARSFPAAASASSSCGSGRRPAPSSSRPSGWPTTCSTRSTSAAGPDNVEITLGLRRRPALVVSDQHDLSVDRRLARRRAAGGAQAGSAAFGSTDFEETLRRRFREAISRRAVLVRAGRHRQPDHELRRARRRSRSRSPARTSPPAGRSPRRSATSSRRFPRFAICSSARRSTIRRFRSTSNRQMAGQLGVTVEQVGRSFAAATSSSRFVAPNYWADPRTGIAFQVQVEVPQPRMTHASTICAWCR